MKRLVGYYLLILFMALNCFTIVSAHADEPLNLAESKKGCNAGKTRNCIELGILADKQGGKEQAKYFYKKACNGKDMMGCYNLAFLENKRGNKSEAMRLYKKACSGGEAMACDELGSAKVEKEMEAKDRHLIAEAKSLEKFKDCKNVDLTYFLGPTIVSFGGVKPDTLYHGEMEIIQKTPEGCLMVPVKRRNFPSSSQIIFVKMKPNGNNRMVDGWFYMDGQYEYTALDGFQQTVPLFRIHPGRWWCEQELTGNNEKDILQPGKVAPCPDESTQQSAVGCRP